MSKNFQIAVNDWQANDIEHCRLNMLALKSGYNLVRLHSYGRKAGVPMRGDQGLSKFFVESKIFKTHPPNVAKDVDTHIE